MRGLDPRISLSKAHPSLCKRVDGRNKSGHDVKGAVRNASNLLNKSLRRGIEPGGKRLADYRVVGAGHQQQCEQQARLEAVEPAGTDQSAC